jgi:type VI secretion system protein ImpL
MATGSIDQPAASCIQSIELPVLSITESTYLSYTIDIDGQRMVFENGIQQWVNFVWPNQGAIPGARITAVDLEGKTHTILKNLVSMVLTV